MECAALVRAIRLGDLDRLIIRNLRLDVLAQQIVAICASGQNSMDSFVGQGRGQDGPRDSQRGRRRYYERGRHFGRGRYCGSGSSGDGWGEDELFALVRRAYPYRDLKRETFDSILEMLSEGIAARRGRYGAYVHRDRVNGRLRARRGARLAAITSGGAIPDNSLYTVVAEPDGVVVEPWMKILRWRAIAATSCYWEIRRGGFIALRLMRGGCWCRTRTGRRRACRSGGARLQRGLKNYRCMWAICGKKSARCCPALLQWAFQRRNRKWRLR